MRLALFTHSRRRVGGVESYLEALAAGMSRRGHTVALWAENDEPPHRPPFHLPPGAAIFGGGNADVAATLAELRKWRPDAVFTHGLLDPALEEELVAAFPALVLLHNYYGACISGHKAWSAPGTPRPCSRPFGAGCLLHYYPHRCGGLDPRTMWRRFRLQSRRRELLGRYRARLVFSQHMAREYDRLGFPAEVLPLPPSGLEPEIPLAAGEREPANGELRLVFLGRTETLKGGAVLLAAVGELLGAEPGRRVRLDFGGQGSAEAGWRELGTRLETRFPGRAIVRFHGWLEAAGREELLATAHLLVVPSLWPEPLGLVGGEAAARGVPAVAFAVGGIPEWLHDGVNGVLAPGDPPTAGGLAAAIRRATADAGFHARLREGAWRSAAHPGERAEQHFAALEAVCQRVAATATAR